MNDYDATTAIISFIRWRTAFVFGTPLALALAFYLADEIWSSWGRRWPSYLSLLLLIVSAITCGLPLLTLGFLWGLTP